MAILIRGGRVKLKGVVHIFSGGSSVTPPPPPPPASNTTTYSISANPPSGSEGSPPGMGTVFTYTVARMGVLSKTSRVVIAFSGSATMGDDYTVSGLDNGAISFPADAATASFSVTSIPDTTYEGNETVTATLSEIDSAESVVFGTSAATVTIANDDSAPSNQPPIYAISVNPPNGPEGNPGGDGTIYSFTVTRSGNVSQPGSVIVSFGGSASRSTDYTTSLTSSTISFAAGETLVPFTVTSVPDTMVEPSETIIVTLGAITGGGTLGTASATATIENDDVATGGNNQGVPITDGNGNPVTDANGDPIYADTNPGLRAQDNSGYVQSQDGNTLSAS